jgi:hypothetical protein
MNEEIKQKIKQYFNEINSLSESIQKEIEKEVEHGSDNKLYKASTQIAAIGFLSSHWDEVNIDMVFGNEIRKVNGHIIKITANDKFYVKVEMANGMNFPTNQ